jgi:hypothetical protein
VNSKTASLKFANIQNEDSFNLAYKVHHKKHNEKLKPGDILLAV